jgi:hypothetical protein
MQQVTQSLIGIVNTLRGIAKAIPQSAPHVAEANEAIQKIMAASMQAAQPAEPQAPPNGG